MRVLALASQKGGSGKTTLSGHLAVQAQRAGAGPVVLIDIDPQGSLADWWNEREAEYPAFAQTTVARLANDLAILNSAALVSVDKSGKCVLARVFVGGGVGEAPVRSISAEAVLTGHALTESLCAEAGRAARGDVEPLDDHRASAAYRKAMSGVFVERTLKKVLERLEP